jgi:ABC-type bacteriocin/lantibiotic exporter with double-glycine peptidase domain
MATVSASSAAEEATSTYAARAWHGEPPKDRVFGWIDSERGNVWTLAIYSIAIALLSLVLPVAIQALVNTIAFGSLLQPVVVLGTIVFVALAFVAVLDALRTWVVEIIQRRIFVRVTSVAVHRLLRVKVESFDSGHGPELVNRFFDVVTVQKGGAVLLVDGLAILTQILVGMTLLAVYHPLLLGFGVVILGAIVVILFPMGRGAVDTAIYESKAKYAVAAWLEELARFPSTFKTGPGAKLANERANELAGRYLYYRGKHFRVLFRQIIGSVSLEAVASSALLIGGGWLVIERQLTLGQLVAAELVLTRVVGSFSKIGKHLETYYDLLAAVDKLGYLMDLPLESTGREVLPASTGPARFEMTGVSFVYDSGVPVFDRASWRVNAGERVAITGASGSGKSSLLDLIYRFRDPEVGRLEFDSHDYRDLNLEALRSQIQLVRDEGAFQGTVIENVRLGEKSYSLLEVREVLAKVGIEQQVLSLPNGLETELSTFGLPLSKSQCCRLILARAILQKPRLMLIDEVLDSLVDLPGGEQLCRLILDKSNPWTVVVTTRNTLIASMCDREYTMEDGQIREVLR